MTSNRTFEESLEPKRLVIGIFSVLVTVFTFLGNLLVLIAIKREKKLQTKFNIYITNLAVTDLTVAVTAMSFYATNTILGYWPFGKFLCGLWIFNDYGMTFASVFTIIIISIDRFWAVTWPNHFKTYHTKKKCILLVVVTWVFMVVLWLPACIVDRLRNQDNDTYICIWDPALNKEFVVVIASIGHHGSFLIILTCYIRVFYTLRKRTVKSRKIVPVTPTVYTMTEMEPNASQVEANQRHDDIQIFKPEEMSGKIKQETEMKSSYQSDNQLEATSNVKSSVIKEKRAFITLTYIIVGYVICWLPFHVVFDISAVQPEFVPETVFNITFWLTYMNSTINPFLYNFSNQDFRKAFKKILFCK